MKKIVCIAFLMPALQSLAQDCQNYFFLQKNKTIEMTIYNQKNDPNGKEVYQVTDVTNTGSTTTASVSSDMFDKNGKSLAKATSSIKCSSGNMLVDVKMMMPQQQAQQYNNAEAKGENVYLEYPADIHVGDQLKDANITLDITNRGMQQNLTLFISNRKVENKETITTTAGTWDCFKISFKVKITVKVGPIGIPVNLDEKEWFAPGFGVVKTQSKSGGTAITSIR